MGSKEAVAGSMRSQASLEYLTVYVTSIILIIVALTTIYLYLRTIQSTPSTCTFANGFYCKDIILQSNTITHNTFLTVSLINGQAYAISNPKIFVRMNTSNTTTFSCSPNFVLPGGSIICTANIPIGTTLGVLLSGDMYLNATYCGLLGNYIYTSNCVGGPRETYHGTFTGHTETQISTASTIALIAANSIQYANNAKNALVAVVRLNGYPVSGATVGFAANNIVYSMYPVFTNTNAYGVALSYLWGKTTGNVLITATYAGLSNSIVVQFLAPPITISTTTSIPTVPTTTSAASTSSSPTTSVRTTIASSTSTSTSTTSTSSTTIIYYVYCTGQNGYGDIFGWYCVGYGASCPNPPTDDNNCACDIGYSLGCRCLWTPQGPC